MTVRPAALGCAMAGTGTVSHSVASDLRHLDAARRVAVWSRDQRKAERFAQEHDFDRHYSSFEGMLAAPDAEHVYIATPHSTHAALALAALEAGKHVLIEKPIGVDASEARAIADAALAHGRFAMEGMWMKFNPSYIVFRAEAESGELGDIHSLRASFGLPFGEPDSARWNASRRSSTLLDQAIYAVTLARDAVCVACDGIHRAHSMRRFRLLCGAG